MTKPRVIAALIMAPLAIAAILLLPTGWLAAAAALVFLTGLWEWLKLAGVEDTLHRTILLVLNLLLMVLLVWASAGSDVLFRIVSLVGAIGWIGALCWLRWHGFSAGRNTAANSFKLAAGTLAIVPAWCALVLLHHGEPHGNRWLLTALALVWAADSGAYFAGRHFGRHKLAPHVSPNKTVEGLVGGLVTAVAVALPLGLWAGVGTAQLPALLAVVLVATLASVVGDLTESLMKRQAGVKDSGNLIPGHGGMLDRIDAILAALPVFVVGKDIFGF